MQQYLAFIVAGLLLVLSLVAGALGILPSATVTTVVQILISFILGHAVSFASVHLGARHK